MNIDVDEEPKIPVEKKPEKAPPVQAAYKAGQVTPDIGDWNSIYYPEVFEYARKFGYFIVPTIAEAMKQRAEGKKVMTAREADIACRGSVDLSSALLVECMRVFESNMIVEDYVGSKTSTFELRNIYNQKVKFLQGTPTNEDIIKVKAQMRKILYVLAHSRVPAFPDEEKNGFHTELCKPDYMTWQQYYEKMKNDPTESLHNWEEILKTYEQHTER